MEESGLPLEEVMKEAQSIIDQMAHNLKVGVIRGFAMVLSKVLRQLFQRIYVNEEAVQKVSLDLVDSTITVCVRLVKSIRLYIELYNMYFPKI